MLGLTMYNQLISFRGDQEAITFNDDVSASFNRMMLLYNIRFTSKRFVAKPCNIKLILGTKMRITSEGKRLTVEE